MQKKKIERMRWRCKDHKKHSKDTQISDVKKKKFFRCIIYRTIFFMLFYRFSSLIILMCLLYCWMSIGKPKWILKILLPNKNWTFFLFLHFEFDWSLKMFSFFFRIKMIIRRISTKKRTILYDFRIKIQIFSS